MTDSDRTEHPHTDTANANTLDTPPDQWNCLCPREQVNPDGKTLIDTEPPAPPDRHRTTLEVINDLVFAADQAARSQQTGADLQTIDNLERARELVAEALSHFGETEEPLELAPPAPVTPPPFTDRRQLLDLARARVAPNSYGDLYPHFELVARMWESVLHRPTTPVEVSLCLAALKLARLIGDPRHVDSYTDLAGYAAVGAELATCGDVAF